MDLENWQSRLDAARTEGGVVLVMRAFLAEWPDCDFQALPENCRPLRLVNGDDITHWAYTLASAHLASFGSNHGEELLRVMAGLFAQASSRLAVLALPRLATAHLFVDQPSGVR